MVPKAGGAAGSLYPFSPELLAELLRGERAASPSCSVLLHKQVIAIRLYETTWENILYSLSYSITRPVNSESTEEATQVKSVSGIEVAIISVQESQGLSFSFFQFASACFSASFNKRGPKH